jgi:hypothetical protein
VPAARKEPITIEWLLDRTMPIPFSGCFIWLSDVYGTGYGRIYIKRRAVRTHRMMWELVHGPIPTGMFVCHKCDVRCCINPDHLFLGTCLDNTRDKERKGRGRQRRGSESGKAKLNETQVAEILVDPRGCARLAAAYGVSNQTIKMIRRRRTWRHVA